MLCNFMLCNSDAVLGWIPSFLGKPLEGAEWGGGDSLKPQNHDHGSSCWYLQQHFSGIKDSSPPFWDSQSLPQDDKKPKDAWNLEEKIRN